MKRILSVLLLCALILSAVPACGESKTASDGSETNSGAGQSQSADPSSPGEEEKAALERRRARLLARIAAREKRENQKINQKTI